MSSFTLRTRRRNMCYCPVLLNLQKVLLGMTSNLKKTHGEIAEYTNHDNIAEELLPNLNNCL